MDQQKSSAPNDKRLPPPEPPSDDTTPPGRHEGAVECDDRMPEEAGYGYGV
jgi:hypothetical protein